MTSNSLKLIEKVHTDNVELLEKLGKDISHSFDIFHMRLSKLKTSFNILTSILELEKEEKITEKNGVLEEVITS